MTPFMQLYNPGDDTAYFQSSTSGLSMPTYVNPYWTMAGTQPVRGLSTIRVGWSTIVRAGPF